MRWFTIVNGAFALSFVAFALLQGNDPDPMLWMLYYGLASLACVLFQLERLPPAAAGSYAVLSGVLALVWIVLVAAGRPLPGAIAEMQYEEPKEILGFLLVGAWMAVLYVRGRRTGVA